LEVGWFPSSTGRNIFDHSRYDSCRNQKKFDEIVGMPMAFIDTPVKTERHVRPAGLRAAHREPEILLVDGSRRDAAPKKV
jgi:hypothetical protein